MGEDNTEPPAASATHALPTVGLLGVREGGGTGGDATGLSTGSGSTASAEASTRLMVRVCFFCVSVGDSLI